VEQEKAEETVQRTVSRGKRRELGRAAGKPRFHPVEQEKAEETVSRYAGAGEGPFRAANAAMSGGT
jgi:hypothetical protein